MKISNLEDYLYGIAIGIRFRANFSIEDRLGEIVDNILYKKEAFFSPKIFPAVLSKDHRKVLINEVTNDTLTIDNSNIILELYFQEGGGTFQQLDQNKILTHFNKELIEGVLRDFKIKEINRIGLIRKYLFKIEDFARIFVDKTIGKTLDGVNEIDLRFSKKIPTMKGTVKKDNCDYYNAIFNVAKKANLQEIFMSIDFQKYFDPFLPSYAEIEFQKFLSSAQDFNDKNYLPWLNSNFMEAIDG